MSTVELRPNLFGIALGIAGLATCWSAAHQLVGAPEWPGAGLWVVSALVWLVVATAWLAQVRRGRGLRQELADPTFGPLASIGAILPMLLGQALARYAFGAGRAVFLAALVLTVALGAHLSGEWILSETTLAQWHPGYLLPTVAGGLVGAGGSAVLGFPLLARLLFGYGVVCWLVLGSVVLARLFTQPLLPPALRPTMAIEVAPPVVAGGAWFAMNGNRPDAVAAVLAGYGALMVLVQVRLVPAYAAAPFGPGTWAFSFSYAAAFAVAIRWLAAEHVPAQRTLTYVLLGLVTAMVLTLVLATVRALRRGTFLPRRPVAAAGEGPLVEVLEHDRPGPRAVAP